MISNSDRSRVANISYSAHSRSVISLTAVRLSRLRPAASANTDRLNVAGRQLARIHLHRQSLQLLGAALHHFASKPTTSPVRVAIGMTFSVQPAACLDPSGPGERNFALPKPVKGSILASQPLGSRQMSVEGGGPR